MAILGDPLRRIAGVIDQDFLGDEEDPAGVVEPLDVERAILGAKLHQVDAGQIAGRVVEEHIFRARVRGVNPPRVRAGVPMVDRRVVLHARIAAGPSAFGHPIEHVAGRPRGTLVIRVGDPMRGPRPLFDDGLHELIADAHGEIGVLEHNRAIGLAVEIGLVAPLLDQHERLPLLLRLALDELHDVGVPDLERLHLGGAAGLAAALHHGRDLVVHAHERKRAARLAAAGELLAMRAQRAQIGPRARAELEQHGLAAGEIHDVFHVVAHALDEAGRALRKLIRIFRLIDGLRDRVPMPIALRALHAVLMKKADVEPDRAVERPVLMQAEPGQLAVESFAIFGGGEIAVVQAPIGDRAAHAVNDLADAVLALGRVVLAVEIFADDDVRGELAPGLGDFDVRLLEEHVARFLLDRGGAIGIPFDRVERIGDVGGAKDRLDRQAIGSAAGGMMMSRSTLRGAFHTGQFGSGHGSAPSGKNP